MVAIDRVALRLIYHGAGPARWSGGPGDFGVQDKAGALHHATARADGGMQFDLALEVKSRGAGAPVFLGPFAHGPPDGRFLYLSWREPRGGYAQRFKLPLGAITWRDILAAGDQPLQGDLFDRQARATSTGVNIGGARAVVWQPAVKAAT